MLTGQNLKQKRFFENIKSQFSKEKILSPLPQHQLEIFHISKLLGLTAPKSILDFGSGTGRISFPFLQSGFNVYAVDLSENSLSTLRKTYKKHKKASWGKLSTSNTIPKNMMFDAVIGGDILHHISIAENLPFLFKALTPGGVIVFSEPNALYPLWYIFFFLFYSWEIEKGILQCTIPNLTKQFKKAGFSDIKIEGHGLLPTPLFNFSPKLGSFNALTLGNLPITRHFAFRLIIKAQKPK